MYKKILVPIDGSETSLAALRTALDLARLFGGQLRLVHVMDDWDSGATGDAPNISGDARSAMAVAVATREATRKLLDEGLALAAGANVPATSVLVERTAPIGLMVAAEAQAWKADLVVVGTHGRRGVQRLFMGSGAEQIIRSAPVPVLAVRKPSGLAA